ncbi:MAG: PorV/PorQ family protein [Bacteroidales bacterium]|nr:PorV/PorQ family protein [Bacteroidales bacterium]
MKKIYLLTVLIWALPMLSKAQGVFSFLDMDADARTAAMAGAGSVAGDNPLAVYSNPSAALAGNRKGAAGLLAGPWNTSFSPDDVIYGAGGFWRPGGRNLVFAGIRYVSGEKMDMMDDYGNACGTMRSSDWAVDMGYGRLFGKHWAVSLAARYVRSDAGYGDTPSNAAMFDLHGAYLGQFGNGSGCCGKWNAGLSVKGLGPAVRIGGSSYALPLDIVAAGAVECDFSPEHVLLCCLDLRTRVVPERRGVSETGAGSETRFVAGAGVEYVFLRHGVVRAGYSISDSSFASAGLGVIFGPFRFDAAMRFCNDRHNPLHCSSVFSASVLF